MTDEPDVGVAPPRRQLLFLAAGALLGGACLLVVGLGGLDDAAHDAGWRATNATVLAVRSGKRPYTCGGASPRRCVGATVHVEYAWTVDGARYTGARYAQDEPDGLFGEDTADEAVALVARLQAERTMTAYVDPADPARAVLFRREAAPAAIATWLGAALGCAALALIAIYAVQRRTYRRARAAFAAL